MKIAKIHDNCILMYLVIKRPISAYFGKFSLLQSKFLFVVSDQKSFGSFRSPMQHAFAIGFEFLAQYHLIQLIKLSSMK